MCMRAHYACARIVYVFVRSDRHYENQLTHLQ